MLKLEMQCLLKLEALLLRESRDHVGGQERRSQQQQCLLKLGMLRRPTGIKRGHTWEAKKGEA